MEPTQELVNIKCENENTPSSVLPENLCKIAFDYYNLYPSTNPMVIRGKNIKQNLKNNITDISQLGVLAGNNSNYITDSNTISGIQQGLDNILQEAPIKLGCCGRINPNNNSELHLSVKAPLSPSIASENNTLKLFNYEKDIITIPAETCPNNLTPGSSDCNAFFDVYCANVIDQFNKQGLAPSLFTTYAPECACYVPKTKEQQYYPAGTPSQCFKDGCIPNSVSYLDPGSRGQTCSMTVCQNIVNTAGLSAGGSANINPTLQNNCGQYSASSGSGNTLNKESNTNSPNNLTNINEWIIYVTIIVISMIVIGISYYLYKKFKKD